MFEYLNGGGLASAVRPEQSEDLALVNGEVESVDGVLVAVGLAETRNRDGRFGTGRCGHGCERMGAPRASASSLRTIFAPRRPLLRLGQQALDASDAFHEVVVAQCVTETQEAARTECLAWHHGDFGLLEDDGREVGA